MFGSIFLCEGRRYVLLGAFSSSQAQLVVSISHTLLWLETWGAICQAAVSERMSLEAEVVICVFSGLLRKKTTTENTQNSINSTASLRKKKKNTSWSAQDVSLHPHAASICPSKNGFVATSRWIFFGVAQPKSVQLSSSPSSHKQVTPYMSRTLGNTGICQLP